MKNMPNIPATRQRLDQRSRRRRCASGRSAAGSSGSRAVASRTRKATSSASATAPKRERAARAPAVLGGRLDDRVDEQHQRAGDQARRRGRRRRGARPMPRSLLEQAAARRIAVAIADRDVDEEDPVPVDRLGQDAAGQQADRAAGGGDEAVDADRLRLLARLGEHRDDHARGRRPRSSRRRRPGRSARRPASPGSGRRRRASEATVKTPRPARKIPRREIEVAEPAGEQQQAAEGDQVGVDDPGEARTARSRGRSWIDGSATFTTVRVEDDHQHRRRRARTARSSGSGRCVGGGGLAVMSWSPCVRFRAFRRSAHRDRAAGRGTHRSRREIGRTV